MQTHHYHAVGEALIGALAAHLAPDWDDALEAAWRRAYNLVAEVMMAAAADVSAGATAGRQPGRSPDSTADVRVRSDRAGVGGSSAASARRMPVSHRAGDHVPGRHPGVADRRGEPFAETLLERPQQGRADDVEVLVAARRSARGGRPA